MTRLESISNELATAFSEAERELQVCALNLACSRAIRDNDLEGDEISEAMEVIHSGGRNAALSHKMEKISQGFDDQYFELTDEDQETPLLPGALSSFQKARATSALALGLSGEQNAIEALYEAISASPNQDELISALLKLL